MRTRTAAAACTAGSACSATSSERVTNLEGARSLSRVSTILQQSLWVRAAPGALRTRECGFFGPKPRELVRIAARRFGLHAAVIRWAGTGPIPAPLANPGATGIFGRNNSALRHPSPKFLSYSHGDGCSFCPGHREPEGLRRLVGAAEPPS